MKVAYLLSGTWSRRVDGSSFESMALEAGVSTHGAGPRLVRWSRARAQLRHVVVRYRHVIRHFAHAFHLGECELPAHALSQIFVTPISSHIRRTRILESRVIRDCSVDDNLWLAASEMTARCAANDINAARECTRLTSDLI